jgi:hypothetical protein
VTPVRRLLDRALVRLADIGAAPGDDEERRLQKALLVLIAILILPIAGIWAALYLALGAWTGWIAVLYAIISAASIAIFVRTRDFSLLLNIQLLDIATAPTLSMIFIGGFLPTGRSRPVGHPRAARGTGVPRSRLGHPLVRPVARSLPRVRPRCGPARRPIAPARVVLEPDAGAQHLGGRGHRVHAASAVREAEDACVVGPRVRDAGCDHVTGRPIGLSALIGFLMLIGIVVTNAIVLLDLVERLRAEGLSTRDALIAGGHTRIRPILMTAIATILALVPLAAGFNEGSIIAAELGTVVIGGLLSSTFLTLLVVPAVYSLVAGAGQRLRQAPAEASVRTDRAAEPA